jgi:hypothetical protein
MVNGQQPIQGQAPVQGQPVQQFNNGACPWGNGGYYQY